MKEAKISCPKCGGHLVFPTELAGQEAPCPHCNESILLPKTKPKTTWIIATVFVFSIICIASIVIWKHQSKHDVVPQVRVAENTNPPPVILQKDPLATGQLMSAVQYGGNVDTIKPLLEKGADVNAKDNDGWTPLQFAAKRGSLEIVRLLLENGADAKAKSNDGGTALMSAAKRGYMEIAELLVAKGADVNAKIDTYGTALTFAAAAGETNAVGFLLDKGADINATNYGGDTALMEAVNQGKTEVVKQLLASGAKVNSEDMFGDSALDAARKIGNTAIVKLLQQAGATKSSSTKQDEAMANNMKEMSNSLQELEASNRNFTNKLQKFQESYSTPVSANENAENGLVVSAKPAFEVLNVTAKPTEQNSVWWRYGYRLTVRNNGMDTDRQYFEIQFHDAEGYVIDTKTERAVIKPGTTNIITGETLVNLPGAARVAKLKAIWNP
jgi:ankyrin repeat protein